MIIDAPILLFDGSQAGLLTAVFEVFDHHWWNASIYEKDKSPSSLFNEQYDVITDDKKAKRVWTGLKKKLEAHSMRNFIYASFAEDAKGYQQLLDMAVYVFKNEADSQHNYGYPAIIGVNNLAKSVSREAHRMKAFVRFQKWNDGTFFESVRPDFNVLPLVAHHFKNRYADQPWIIYDELRHYGMYYDKTSLKIISFDFIEDKAKQQLPATNGWDENESKYDQLWKTYYKSTNIAARKNEKLHRRHVPLRYRFYLNEFTF